jgi:hypothetical protein
VLKHSLKNEGLNYEVSCQTYSETHQEKKDKNAQKVSAKELSSLILELCPLLKVSTSVMSNVWSKIKANCDKQRLNDLHISGNVVVLDQKQINKVSG